MRFLNGGKPTPRDEVRTRIIPLFPGYHERLEGVCFWAAAESATGQFSGWFHFRPPFRTGDMPAGRDEDSVAELGYRLRRPAWGKGYTTEGSRALIDKGFTESGVRRVVAETLAGNRGSRRVLEKSSLTRQVPSRPPGQMLPTVPSRAMSYTNLPGPTGKPGTARSAEQGYPGHRSRRPEPPWTSRGTPAHESAPHRQQRTQIPGQTLTSA